MENFTPLSAAIGGALIGVSAVLFMALNGRVAGISGIVAGILTPAKGDWLWRGAFISGLFVAPLLVWAVAGRPEVTFTHPLAAAARPVMAFAAWRGCQSGQSPRRSPL